MTTNVLDPAPVGGLLREWRQRRRLSQLELSLAADVSTRHLSYIETGRSRPTSQMILKLADRLDVPLRERNALLLAGGYAPAYPEHQLSSPDLGSVCSALRQVLAGHEPYPAVVVDRTWTMVCANSAVDIFTDGVAAHLVEPPANALRLTLHPDGMAPRITNHGQWRAHLLGRLRHQAEATADVALAELYRELADYPCATTEPEIDMAGPGSVVVPLRFRYRGEDLAFFSTTAVFGTPLDVTVAELAIESFYPADDRTADILRHRSARAPRHPEPDPADHPR